LPVVPTVVTTEAPRIELSKRRLQPTRCWMAAWASTAYPTAPRKRVDGAPCQTNSAPL